MIDCGRAFPRCWRRVEHLNSRSRAFKCNSKFLFGSGGARELKKSFGGRKKDWVIDEDFRGAEVASLGTPADLRAGMARKRHAAHVLDIMSSLLKANCTKCQYSKQLSTNPSLKSSVSIIYDRHPDNIRRISLRLEVDGEYKSWDCSSSPCPPTKFSFFFSSVVHVVLFLDARGLELSREHPRENRQTVRRKGLFRKGK